MTTAVPGEPRADTRAPLKGSLCSQPLPIPATPLFQRWKNSRGVKAPCCPNSPGLVRPLVQPSPPAALLPARPPVPTSGPCAVPAAGLLPGRHKGSPLQSFSAASGAGFEAL